MSDRGQIPIDLGGRDAADVWSLMTQQALSISNNELAYDPFTQNSNSVVTSVLHAVGIDVDNAYPYPTNTNDALTWGETNHLDFGRNLTGSAHDDTIVGWHQGDFIDGGGGNDVIDTGGVSDATVCGYDVVAFHGDFGNDTVTGGAMLNVNGKLFSGSASDDGASTVDGGEKYHLADGTQLEKYADGSIKIFEKGGSITITDYDATSNNYGITLAPATPYVSLSSAAIERAYSYETISIQSSGSFSADMTQLSLVEQAQSQRFSSGWAVGDHYYDTTNDAGTSQPYKLVSYNGDTVTYVVLKVTIADVGSSVSDNAGNGTITATLDGQTISHAATDVFYSYGDLHDANADGHDDNGLYAQMGSNAGTILIGSGGSDTLTGTAGNDLFLPGLGNNVLAGGAGNDTYVFAGNYGANTISDSDGSGSIVINGVTLGGGVPHAAVRVAANEWSLDGHDLVLDGTTLTIHSAGAITIEDFTSGDLGITLDSGSTVITGTAGNDTLASAQFADTIDGGAGVDTVSYDASLAAVCVNLATNLNSGGAAQGDVLANIENVTGSHFNDALTGDANNNVLSGGEDNDTLNGAAGADTLVGGLGDDVYYVDNAGDQLVENAGEGVDSVYSTITLTLAANIDNLTLLGSTAINGTGNALDNYLMGNDGANLLTANDGNDTLDGGLGHDTMIGGNGNDVYYVESSYDVVTEAAGGGDDTVFSTITYTLGANVENLTLTGISAINGTGNTLDNVLTGNSGNNYLYGLTGSDVIDGGDGDDKLYGDGLTEAPTDGNDLIHGGDGNDTIYGDGGENTLYGDAGNDYMVGGNGVDLLFGGDGADSLYGLAGSDILYGGDGNDLLQGDAAIADGTGLGSNDTLYGGAGSDVIYGYGGDDVIYGADATDSIGGNDTLYGGYGNDLIYGYAGADYIIGGEGNNTIDGGDGNDRITAGNGADLIYGGAGDDNIASDASTTVGGGADTIFGGLGADLIWGYGGNDLIYGGNHDALDTLDGNDVIHGGDGNDTIYGEAGNDSIYGDTGSDQLFGGQGDDYIVGSVDGENTLDGGAGNDQIFGKDLADFITGGDGNDSIYGDHDTAAGGNDTLIGGLGSDLIYGYGGNDLIYGGNADGSDTVGGNDTIFGGLGDDTIYGGAGNNSIQADGGNNLIFAGKGDDIFYYYYNVTNAGNDTISGLNESGHDIIQMHSLGFTFSADIVPHTAYDFDAGTAVITLADSGTITLTGIHAALTSDNFAFV